MTAIDENQAELLAGFIDESANSIIDLPESLKNFLDDSGNKEAINSVFRSVHSIKGNAGFFGLTAVKKFSHALENTLDDVRNNVIDLNEELYRSLVKGFDNLDELLRQVADGEAADDLGECELDLLSEIEENCGEVKDQRTACLSQISSIAEEMATSEDSNALEWASQLMAILEESEGSGSESSEGTVAEIISPEEMRQKTFFANSLDVSPQIIPLIELFETLLSLDKYNTEQTDQLTTHLNTVLEVTKQSSDAEIAKYVEDAISNYHAVLNSPLDLDPNLLSAIWEYVIPALTELSKPLKNESTKDVSAEQTEGKEPAKKEATTKKAKMIRINEDRLEGFLDDVSNLFITCERFKDVQQRMSNRMKADTLVEELRQITLTLSSQTNGLQTSVAVLRKIPIRGLFSKFPKMARSLAEGLGKKIDVHLSGEDHEADKSLLEDLDAPLAHMIRNVADHALEIPEERVARGVSEVGNLWLSAETTRTHLVITIRDDGRGIDPHKLKSKAVEKGVISEAQANQMSDQEAINLVFHPGFST
ncbi:MAG: hypothetical protein COA78_38285, partial [Blastopirellula sp.]